MSINNFYSKHEITLKKRIQEVYLPHLLRLHGIPLRLRKSVVDVYSNVYGVESGEVNEDFEEIVGLVVADTFDAADSRSTGVFDEGWLYTNEGGKVNVGDLVEVERDDGLYHQYKVIRRESIGLTQEVMSKFRLSSYGQEDK